MFIENTGLYINYLIFKKILILIILMFSPEKISHSMKTGLFCITYTPNVHWTIDFLYNENYPRGEWRPEIVKHFDGAPATLIINMTVMINDINRQLPSTNRLKAMTKLCDTLISQVF